MGKKLYLMSAALFAGTFAGSAFATPLTFTLTGTDTASFTLDSNAIPTTTVLDAHPSAQYYDLTGLFEGAPATFTFDIFTTAGGGGFQLTLKGSGAYISPYDAAGTMIFTGTLDNPVFSPGTFLFNMDFGKGAVSDKLVISDPSVPTGPTGSVPEPASWAFMVSGFGMMGAAMRRRKSATKIVNA